MPTPYEVEVKIPINDAKTIEHVLLEMGGTPLNSEIQTDIYYDHPCRSFSQSDESIRIRSREPLDQDDLVSSKYDLIELTYKGPKIDKTTKTRIEFTTGISDISAITSILENTGFTRVATIMKLRAFFDVDGVTVSIDDVDRLGLFLELELIADGKKRMEAAKEKVISLIKRLGLDPSKIVRESYLELYLDRST